MSDGKDITFRSCGEFEMQGLFLQPISFVILGRVCSLTKIAKTSRSTENKERLLRIHMLKSVDNCDRDCLTTKHEMGCSKTDGLM